MFYKLRKQGMDNNLWRILINMYEGFMCSVRVRNKLSSWFNASQGVHQGAPWSMKLFILMHNELIQQLKQSGQGLCIMIENTTSPTFADDIALVTLHKRCMQVLLDIAYRYSRQWRFHFNASKSEVIIFGQDKCSSTNLRLGDSVIVAVDVTKHMGVCLANSDKLKVQYVDGKILNSKCKVFATIGLGNERIPTSINVASRLYWTSILPSLLHGVETADYPDAAQANLEQFHGQSAKYFQNLPLQSPNVSCLATIGWKSMESHINILMLTFLWRLLLLPMNCVYKRVVLIRLWYHMYVVDGKHQGPTWNMLQRFREYGLIGILSDVMNTGYVMPIQEFKRLVHNLVINNELKRYKISCHLYSSLKLFKNCIPNIKMWPWWLFCLKNPKATRNVRTLLRIMCGRSELRSDKIKFGAISNVCYKCDLNVMDSITHVVFECPESEIMRQNLMREVAEVAPPLLNNHFQMMPNYNKTLFLLSGLNDAYVCEWDLMYHAMLNLVIVMYNQYVLNVP